MSDQKFEQQLIILFDEQGTPTFSEPRETDSFIGVSVMYDLSDEEGLFKITSEQFGLSNKRPLKNSRISEGRANRIAHLVTELPIQITISSLNLSDADLQRVINLYAELGTLLRERHRQIRGRPVAHILHPNILDECLFTSIMNYMDRTQRSSRISIFIDDWAIPVHDTEIYLNDRSTSINEKVNSLYEEYGFDFRIDLSPIFLMNEDSIRKRFIDVVTSSISRSFLRRDNSLFSEEPLRVILEKEINQYVDITNKVIEFVTDFMDQVLKDPPIH